MPRILCAKCGYSMILAKSVCPNCGEPLASTSTSTSPSSTASSSPLPPPPLFGGYGTVITPGSGSGSGAYSPTPVSGASPVSARSTVSSPVSPLASSPKATGSPGRASSLDGVVIDPPTTLEILPQPDWSHIAIAFLLFPIGLLVLTAFFKQRREPQFRIIVTRVRILQPSGMMRDARIEGDLLGTGISQGDTVSLQGRDRGGALVVASGYNHTTGGDILIESRSSYTCLRTIVTILLVIYIPIFLTILLTTVK